MFQFAGNLLAAPALHLELTAGEGAGEALFVQVVLSDQLADNFLGEVAEELKIAQFLTYLLMAAILISAVVLKGIECLLVGVDKLFFFCEQFVCIVVPKIQKIKRTPENCCRFRADYPIII